VWTSLIACTHHESTPNVSDCHLHAKFGHDRRVGWGIQSVGFLISRYSRHEIKQITIYFSKNYIFIKRCYCLTKHKKFLMQTYESAASLLSISRVWSARPWLTATQLWNSVREESGRRVWADKQCKLHVTQIGLQSRRAVLIGTSHLHMVIEWFNLQMLRLDGEDERDGVAGNNEELLL